MDFTTLKSLTIPDGVVKKIESNGCILWEELSSYTNQVPISTDTDGNIYNDVGYKNGYRLSSSGAEKTYDYSCVSGYIPASASDIVRIDNLGEDVYEWYDESHAMNYICAYDSDFNYIGGCIPQNGGYTYTTQIYESMELVDGISVIKLADVLTIAYIRVSCYGFNADGSPNGSLMLVTINEEIV